MIGDRTESDTDFVEAFQLESLSVRGRLVRLSEVATRIIGRHQYPRLISEILAEMLVVASALASLLKYEGIFTLQINGEGPLRLMVVDVTSQGAMRGYAQYDGERVNDLQAAGLSENGRLVKLLGRGYISFTVDQSGDTDRYQGVVEVSGAGLADTVNAYFRQSEQIDTGIHLAVLPDGDSGEAWKTGLILLQSMPGQGREYQEESSREDTDDGEDGFRRAMMLLATARPEELAGTMIDAHSLLYRLFHEEGVRVYGAHRLKAECRCSRERAERILRSLSAEELEDLTVENQIFVSCQFCSGRYDFSWGEIESFKSIKRQLS